MWPLNLPGNHCVWFPGRLYFRRQFEASSFQFAIQGLRYDFGMVFEQIVFRVQRLARYFPTPPDEIHVGQFT